MTADTAAKAVRDDICDLFAAYYGITHYEIGRDRSATYWTNRISRIAFIGNLRMSNLQLQAATTI